MHGIFDLATGERINLARDVMIGDHVWIGASARLLKGAAIGNGSIVGANSVVTGRFPENVALAGNPARIVREGVRWSHTFD